MFQVTDERNENDPFLDLFGDADKGVAFSISNFNWVQTSSHFFDKILHFIEIHVVPSQFQKLIELCLTFVNMLPKFLHPSDFGLNILNNFLTSIGLSFWEFEHIFIVLEFLQLFLQIGNIFVNFINFLETVD